MADSHVPVPVATDSRVADSSATTPAPIVVVGAGAAGLMAAIHAAAPGERGSGSAARVVVLERTRDGGRKIVASGGGRCNVLPGELDESRFVTDSSPNTMRKMLRSWPLAAQKAFFEETLGVPLALESESGKLFPASNRARDVRDALVAEARRRGVELRFGVTVIGLDAHEGVHRAAESGARWTVRTSGGDAIDAQAVVLATGGLSVPATGSDGKGLEIAAALGLDVHRTYAALTPLVCQPPLFADLAGVSLDVRLEAPTGRGALRSHGGFLFTHRGYSGPAVLDVSHLAVRSAEGASPAAAPGPATGQRRATGPSKPGADGRRQRILVQWTALDRAAWEAELAPRRQSVAAAVRAHLPRRLADALVDAARVPEGRILAELRRDERERLLDALARFELPWTSHEGYRTAEVTGGGVALSEVDPRTMESRRCPGLFLCGEMLDAFGPIGGYNFAWAWATGRAAGLGARG